jgi:hypothetical protein
MRSDEPPPSITMGSRSGYQFEHVIRHTHFGKFRDDRVPQVVKARSR